MKIIKLLITMSIINALVVVGSVKYSELRPKEAQVRPPVIINTSTPSPGPSVSPKRVRQTNQ